MTVQPCFRCAAAALPHRDRPAAPHPRLPARRLGAAAGNPGDRLALAVCTWCQAEIAGQGRTYYATLEDALRALGCHEGTHRLIREALRFVRFDQVWLPHSESYVALGLDGPGVAWVGKGYVFVKATGAFVELPGYRASRGGGSPLDVRWGATCDRHFVARSLTGVMRPVRRLTCPHHHTSRIFTIRRWSSCST